MEKIILASSSPRRRQLLTQVGIEFEVISPHVDEDIRVSSPEEMVEQLSLRKAKCVARDHPGRIVLGADTVVSTDGKILGKPCDDREAFDMLKALSGKTHQVFTGVSIVSRSAGGAMELEQTFYERTDVTFARLEDDLIRWYISTGEPADKAGAYGIQGKGAVLVDSIQGDFYNVVGLPIAEVYRKLLKETLI